MRIRRVFVLLTAFCIAILTIRASAQVTVIEAEGTAAIGRDIAAARDEALWDAKRVAVERAAGLMLRSRTVARNFSESEELIVAKSGGVLRTWDLVPNSEMVKSVGTGQILTLRIRAHVDLTPLLNRLSANRELYDDLERPTIRVFEKGRESQACIATLTEGLKRDGFVVTSSPAQVEMEVTLRSIPTVKQGDGNAPYQLGESVSACRTEMELAVWNRADDTLIGRFKSQAVGYSFAGDAAACTDAGHRAAQALLAEQGSAITKALLTAWTRERIEGHAVQLRIDALDKPSAQRLTSWLEGLRGTQGEVQCEVGASRTIVRFRTRMENRTLRARLADFSAETMPLVLVSSDGPLMTYRFTRPSAGLRKGGADRRKGTL